MRRLLLLVVAMFAAVPTASATPFTWTVQGTIRSVTGPNPLIDYYIEHSGYAGAFVVGQSFTWTLTIEPSAPDHYPQFENCGLYTPIISMSLVTGGLNLAATPGSAQEYVVNSAGPGSCEPPYDNYARLRSQFDGPGTLGVMLHFFGPFDTETLPISAVGLAGFSMDFTSLNAPIGFFGIGLASGQVTSITSSVPEPTGLTALGLLVLAWRKRRIAMTR